MPSEEVYGYDGERTEPPTERSRERARLEGRAAVSREAGLFFITLAGVVVLYYAGAWGLMGAAGFMQRSFKAAALHPGGMGLADATTVLRAGSFAFVYLIAPLAALPVAGFLSQAVQSGFVSTGRLRPQAARLNPFENLRRLFPAGTGVGALKTAVKLSLLGYAVYAGAVSQAPLLPVMASMDAVTAAGFMARSVFTMMTGVLWALLAVAVIDYAYERWLFERSIMVSRAELKAESAEAEGDPAVRARIRKAQAEAIGRGGR
ncbi:MAG: EscU/YscU/HrcU family type III secretion system export apparatus switch protein [Deltaproteobacteria bacterium]|nr:EscU/YscU/HrcU family type III secretion system export apparatus switch protein [Deltaproteobacteria bacterium]